jgi:predicted transcriptional regulator
MKKLIISIKSPKESLSQAKRAMNLIKKGKIKGTHYEISFEDPKEFYKFVKNIPILMLILSNSPSSIYELAQMAHLDVSNLRRIIGFFEKIGAVRIEEKTVSGRLVKRPVVEYQKVEFDLKAA